MTTPKEKVSLYKKIVNVMGKVERVPKNGYNSFHKYKYATESDLVEHVRKFMVEEGLIVFNNMKSYEVNADIAIATIDYTLCCTDTGESITSTIIAEGQDKGDKKFPKAMASGTKYFLMKTFLIPTGDDPEMDVSNDQRNFEKNKNEYPPKNKNNKAQQSPQKPNNNDPENIEHFQMLKSKWELQAGSLAGFNEWYLQQQKKGWDNKKIYQFFMEAITSRESREG